ncbi:uncharacterized protein RJT21DRAFT_116950 [Scheffersomyces amazonensis]|uniref:uncharacterized protein n=1 Tax=Scheffersomyces amazonensis TaxID=1078765 RepID=UPI00315C9F9F
MRLYELEFNKYFPFIHLPSLKNPMVDNFENSPLLLSMASIGALYSFHDNNTLILFNLSKFHIQSFFEKEITLDNLQFKKVPLMAHQCLVLHIFISMFLNEANMIDITSRQIKSMIGLIKSTNFNEPLEQFLIPPNSILEKLSDSNSDSKHQQLLQNNFDYFIMAQSRIRTIHVFYLLQTFRSSLIGLPIYFNSKFLKNGNHCYREDLWKCETSQAWLNELIKMEDFSNSTNQKQSLVDLSNGESLENLVRLLQDNSINTKYSKLSYWNSLTVLTYIHEQVQSEILNLGKSFTYVDWKLNHKVKLQRLLNNWEIKYLSNDGIITINSYNRNQLNIRNELKLILPLYSLVKIKLEINMNPIMNAVLSKDFVTMNNQINLVVLQEDVHENIKNSLPHCFSIVQIWVQNIETINYDIKQTSLRTPVFFVACLFVATLMISTYLHYLEVKAAKNQELSDNDLINWLNCESKMLIVENVLSPVLKSSYSEMLTKQQDGIFSSIKENKHVRKINQLVEQKQKISNDLLIVNEDCITTQPENQGKLIKLNKELADEIKDFNLSCKVLYLGIRILADAPVWPIAMGLAEALKNRASYLSLKSASSTGANSASPPTVKKQVKK